MINSYNNKSFPILSGCKTHAHTHKHADSNAHTNSLMNPFYNWLFWRMSKKAGFELRFMFRVGFFPINTKYVRNVRYLLPCKEFDTFPSTTEGFKFESLYADYFLEKINRPFYYFVLRGRP